MSLIGCSTSKFIPTIAPETKPSVNALESNKPLFYKDGKEAYFLKCDGPSWSECLQSAGNACRNKGYEVLEKNTVKIPSVIASDKIQNEMYISCKVIEEPLKK
jgi:fructosamine-3-kinase